MAVNKALIKELMNCVINKTVPAEFTDKSVDVNAALRDQFQALVGNYYDFKRNHIDLFEILTEAAEEVIPGRVYPILGLVAEISTVGQGESKAFNFIKGRQRAKSFITKATESGVYQTFRLDREQVFLKPYTHAGAGIIDFERYLDGVEDIMSIYEIIVDAIAEAIFTDVQGALISSWNAAGRPAANKVYANSFDIAEMQALCNTISAYGAPVIYCSPQFAAEMSNAITYDSTTKIPDQDAMDIRERGYIGKFRGTPVVVLPQSFTDETNTKLSFNPRFAYVLPSGKEKIVKVVMEGDTIFKLYENRDNSMEIMGYKKLAVGIINTPNFWGMYYNSGIAAAGWGTENTAILDN